MQKKYWFEYRSAFGGGKPAPIPTTWQGYLMLGIIILVGIVGFNLVKRLHVGLLPVFLLGYFWLVAFPVILFKTDTIYRDRKE